MLERRPGETGDEAPHKGPHEGGGDRRFELEEVARGDRRHRWDEAVALRPEGLYSETNAWREVIAESFGLEDVYLLARRGERVVGGIGLTFNRGLVTGPHATACPLASSGGGLYYQDAAVRSALLARVEEVLRRRRLRYALLELVDRFDRPGWQVVADHVTFSLTLGAGGSERVWAEELRGSARTSIRKALRQPFVFRTGHDQLEPCLDVLHRGIKGLGSPFPGRRLFAACRDRLPPGAVDFGVLYLDGVAAAGCLLLFHQGTVSLPWACTLKAYNRYAANSLLYWRILELGCARGMERADLGRSWAGSTQADFKRHFGGRPRPLYHHYFFTRPGARVPSLDPRAPRFRLAAAVWRRLPDAVTRRLGLRLMREVI